MKRLLLILLPVAFLTGPMASATSVQIGTAMTLERCFEDQPCWDCDTMGNGICGRER